MIQERLAFADKSLTGQDHAAPRLSAARVIHVISLTLALGYLAVLGGTYLKGDFLTDPGCFTSEVFGLGTAAALIQAFPFAKAQTGLAAALVISALILLRACCVAAKSTSH
jgi:hypothetical protein